MNPPGSRAMSIHDPEVTFPKVPSGAPSGGAVAQVIMLSVQRPGMSVTWPPFGLASVTNMRSLAVLAGPVRPATVNRRYVRYAGEPARVWRVVSRP